MLRHSASLPVLPTTKASVSTMRPVLLLAVATWITSVLSITLLALVLLRSPEKTMWPFLLLAAGFSVFSSIGVTRRYRRGILLHQRDTWIVGPSSDRAAKRLHKTSDVEAIIRKPEPVLEELGGNPPN